MSKVWLFCFAGFTSALYTQTTNQPFGSSTPLTCDEVQKQEYDKQKAQLCGYFSQLVGNFLSIVQKPHNSAHVTGNIGEIVQNIAGIVMSCIKKIKRSGFHLTDEDIELIMQQLATEFAEYGDAIRSAVIKRTEAMDLA